MKSLDEAPYVNILSPRFRRDPGSILEPLRSTSSVINTPIGALVIRRDLVHKLLADARLRTALLDVVTLQGVTSGRVFDQAKSSLLNVDGEGHRRLRQLVNRALTPRAIDRHRPMMREVFAELIAPAIDRSRCELMAEVADHYPTMVISRLLGVPSEDHESFAAWSRAMTWVLSFDLRAHFEEAEWGTTAMDDYMGRLVEVRRRAPQDDLVTALVQAEEAGDRLSITELRTLLSGLVFAGIDTTRHQLGLAMALFAVHPDQWSLLSRRPELVPQAVEEVLRVRGAIMTVPRTTVEDVEVEGYLLPAGTLITLSLRAANFDPAAFETPERFDITVERQPHLTFGSGPHYCLGANLARAELQEALTLLSSQELRIVLDGAPRWSSPLGVFGPESLPLRFTAFGSDADPGV